MNNKLIICRVTGTVLALDDCRVVDMEHYDSEASEREIRGLADSHGRTPVDVDNLTEDEAQTLVSALANRFGWKYTVFTQSDVWHCLIDMNGEATAEQIKAVMATRMWTKTLEDAIIREGMLCVYDAIEQAKQGV